MLKQREDGWAALMRAANAGDGAAYERLFRELTPVLRAIARRSTHGAGVAVDAEDIVQETLIAIHLKRHTWLPGEPLGPWVRAIARHKLIDAFRRRGRRIQVPIDDFEDLLPAEESPPEFPRRDLERHLGALPPRQREVIQSIALDGNSIRATATRFGMSEGAVRVALHRAVSALAMLINTADT